MPPRSTHHAVEHSPSLDLSVPSACNSRLRFLERIRQKEAKPFVLMLGLPGAGKTYSMRTLMSALNATSAVRAMPRDLRADDLPTETTWSEQDRANPAAWRDQLFANQPFPGKWYGFRKSALIRSVKAEDNDGVFLQVGHPIDIPPLIDAIRTLFPCAPVVAIRIDAPVEVVRKRLKTARPDSPAQEIQERLELIAQRQQEDYEQLGTLIGAYPALNVLNLSAEERALLGFSPAQIKTIDDDNLLVEETRRLIDRAQESSSAIATHILNPIALTHDDPRIPAAMVSLIETQILPAAGQAGYEPCICAGLAAVLYGSPRVVSNDFDFEVVQQAELSAKISQSLTALKGAPVSVQIKERGELGCLGAHTVLHDEVYNADVEIDANLVPRFRTESDAFWFDFPLDSQSYFLRRTAELADGRSLPIVPPERVVLTKLFMGRGAEQNKFDFIDCAAVLCNQEIDISLIHRMIQTQIFRVTHAGQALDNPALAEELQRTQQRALTGDTNAVDTFLERCGVLHSELRSGLAQWFIEMLDDVRMQAIPEQKRTGVLLTTVKQVAFVGRILQSLDRLWDERHQKLNLGNREASIADIVDLDLLEKRISHVRNTCRFFGLFELGQLNRTHYINRGRWTDGDPTFLDSERSTHVTRPQ